MSSEKRPITIEDLNRIHYVDDPRISPDAQWIAFVKSTPAPDEKTYHRNIWLIATDGSSEAIQLTRSNKDGSPRWSPDGRWLAFTSGRGDASQIYLLPTTAPGGEARALTSHKNGAGSPVWSPDGQYIACSIAMNKMERRQEDSDEDDEPPADKLAGKHQKEREDQEEKDRWDPRPMARIPYRAGTRYLDDRFAQVFVVRVAESDGDDTEKAMRRLTDTDANHGEVVWSPDGKTLYTTRSTQPDSDEPWKYTNIYRIDVVTGEITCLEDTDYSYWSPVLSPDGRWLAAGRGLQGKTDFRGQLVLMDTTQPDEDVVILNDEMDRSVYGFRWQTADRLLLTVGSEGRITPYVYEVESGNLAQITDGVFDVMSMDVHSDGTLAMSVATPRNPSELYVLPPDGEMTQISEVNQAFLDEVIVQETHELRYESADGTPVQGWYLLPVGYEEDQAVPLALNIHGGPHVMWSPSARTMWHEWQVHAARGYAVFYCNPRGSDGYGQDHMSAIHEDWGGVAMMDIMAGVDAFLEMGFVDESRMVITGGSYGGYMTAWITGHTERFKAAVSQRGVYNLLSFYGTSDIPYLISSEFDAEPWEDPDKLWKHSPLAYTETIKKTPLLIIHSELDFRVPIEQAEQLFALVRRGGGTVKMLRYPREGHELSRSGEPEHRISRLKEMVAWFDIYGKSSTV